MRVMVEEINHATPTGVVLRVREYFRADARAREWNPEHFAHGCFGSIGHQDESIGEVERFVDIVRDHDDGHRRFA